MHAQSEHDDDTIKMDKIHANNILNGCNLELHQISMENVNESSVIVTEKNYSNNNNNSIQNHNNNNNSNKIMYQLNKNHSASNGNSDNDSGNNNNNNDNNKNLKIRNNSSSNNHHQSQQQQNHYNNVEMEKSEVKQLGEFKSFSLRMSIFFSSFFLFFRVKVVICNCTRGQSEQKRLHCIRY